MNKVRHYLITTCLLVSTSLFNYGQKTLSEYTIKSAMLEKIVPSSIPDIEAYQREKFESGHAQPRLATETGTQDNIHDRFISKFVPDYALFNHLGAGLVRKGDQWSLVRIWDGQTLGGGKIKKKMHLLEHIISDTLAREILADVAPDNTFAIKQECLDKLPNVCIGDPQKKTGIAGRVSDAATLIIWEFTPTARRKVQFYAADFYYNTCYPYQQEFKILEPMLNTFSTLEKYVKSYVDN